MLRVEIRWIDSGAWHKSEDGWQTREQVMQAASLSEVSSVGWLMGEDEDTYYLALNRIADTKTMFYGAQLIYKPNVISVTRLRARTQEGSDAESNLRAEED